MTLYCVFILISKVMCIYTSEMPVESKDVFHRAAANSLC